MNQHFGCGVTWSHEHPINGMGLVQHPESLVQGEKFAREHGQMSGASDLLSGKGGFVAGLALGFLVGSWLK